MKSIPPTMSLLRFVSLYIYMFLSSFVIFMVSIDLSLNQINGKNHKLEPFIFLL